MPAFSSTAAFKPTPPELIVAGVVATARTVPMAKKKIAIERPISSRSMARRETVTLTLMRGRFISIINMTDVLSFVNKTGWRVGCYTVRVG